MEIFWWIKPKSKSAIWAQSIKKAMLDVRLRSGAHRIFFLDLFNEQCSCFIILFDFHILAFSSSLFFPFLFSFFLLFFSFFLCFSFLFFLFQLIFLDFFSFLVSFFLSCMNFSFLFSFLWFLLVFQHVLAHSAACNILSDKWQERKRIFCLCAHTFVKIVVLWTRQQHRQATWPIVIHPKYSKHWLYLLESTMVCSCCKILNHGWFLLLFKFFGWKYILNWIKNSRLKYELLHTLGFF